MDGPDPSLPALLGGRATVTADHAEANRWPILTEEDEQAVLRVLRDGNLSFHPEVQALEADYAGLTGRRHALAHNNGTAGLLAAFFALDLQPGDEVLVPSATWWASVLPLLWVGLVPVFCDSEEERLGIDPDDMQRKLTERTRAVVVVHLWGMPSKMTRIFELAKQHDLKIIEDASHTHGATWRGRSCGALGDISVFSLQNDKLAPAGEGGILLTDNTDYYERAVCLGDIARIYALESPNRRFAATSFGIKTRMAPLSAAVARVQFRHLAEHNRVRHANLSYLSEGLEALGCFQTYREPAHIKRTYFEFIIHYDAQTGGLPIDTLVAALQAEGCEVTAPRYPLVHEQPFFTEGHWQRILRTVPGQADLAYDPATLSRTRAYSQTLLRLPSFPTGGRDILDQYLTAFRKVLAHRDALLVADAASHG
ncbi:MAG: DegT/DnrJ/EryC1/StrS family aminotransferase [Gammaproteobacteria bacterium]